MDIKELEAQNAALQSQVGQLTAENQGLAAWKRSRIAADEARKALPTVEGYDKLPEPAQARVAAIVTVDVPATESGDFDAAAFNTAAAAAVKDEQDYLAKVAPASEAVRGFGDSAPGGAKPRRTHDAWGDPKKEN